MSRNRRVDRENLWTSASLTGPSRAWTDTCNDTFSDWCPPLSSSTKNMVWHAIQWIARGHIRAPTRITVVSTAMPDNQDVHFPAHKCMAAAAETSSRPGELQGYTRSAPEKGGGREREWSVYFVKWFVECGRVSNEGGMRGTARASTGRKIAQDTRR